METLNSTAQWRILHAKLYLSEPLSAEPISAPNPNAPANNSNFWIYLLLAAGIILIGYKMYQSHFDQDKEEDNKPF